MSESGDFDLGELDLRGSVAIVTGAANGLGAAIAEGLAALGARVLLCDVDADGLARMASALGGRFGADRFATVTADISLDADAERIVARTIEALSGVAVAHGDDLTGLAVRQATLEDVFLQLTGRRIRE